MELCRLWVRKDQYTGATDGQGRFGLFFVRVEYFRFGLNYIKIRLGCVKLGWVSLR
jgi:hypothetical protein